MLFPNKSLYGDDIPSSHITPMQAFYTRRPTRRAFLGAATAAALLPSAAWADDKIPTVPGAPKFQTSEAQTPFSKATTFNNFYEFGVDKDQPAKNAQIMSTRPWPIKLSGLVKKPQTINIDDLIHYRPLESRVYRHRCVEAWSMVIPWDGFSLSELINFAQPLPSAKYVQFLSTNNSKEMPDRPYGYDWPYSEGLRMDEAMHPLTLLCFGCYGQILPNQNGAPVRVVLPWKWGYKSAKSIVEFRFTDKQPRTLWNEANSEEYGFYSNVNPNISHRWSQEHERRIDSSILPHYIPTQMFNGYGDQVASLYAGMDLTKDY
jgi:sulfoxide reductase catalytic subunit YedY